MRDSKYLLPDNAETIKATEILAKEGFVVMPYMYPDLNVARDLVNAGAATIMPLASPIGSNKGLATKEFIQILIDIIGCPADKIGLVIFSGSQFLFVLQGTKQDGQYRFQQQCGFRFRSVAGGDELFKEVTNLFVSHNGHDPFRVPVGQTGQLRIVGKLQQTAVVPCLFSVDNHLVVCLPGDDDEGSGGKLHVQILGNKLGFTAQKVDDLMVNMEFLAGTVTDPTGVFECKILEMDIIGKGILHDITP